MHTLYQGWPSWPVVSNILAYDKHVFWGQVLYFLYTGVSFKLGNGEPGFSNKTFDRPMYWKATKIIVDAAQTSSLKNICLIVGVFHMFINLFWMIDTLTLGT